MSMYKYMYDDWRDGGMYGWMKAEGGREGGEKKGRRDGEINAVVIITKKKGTKGISQ